MGRTRFYLLVLAAGLLSLHSTAQTNTPEQLGLQQAIQQVTQQNAAIVLARLEEKAAALQYKGTDAFFLPQVSLNYSVLATDNPLNAFGFKLQQQIVTASDFNPALLNKPGYTADFTTQLQVRQPLVNLSAFEFRKAAAAGMQAKRFQTERTAAYLAYVTEQVYWNLRLAYRSEEVMTKTLTNLRSLYQFTENRYNQGLMQKSDLLLVAVQVKGVETQLIEVQKGIQDASEQLSLLMQVAPGKQYKPIDNPTPLPKQLLDTVSEKRADFEAMRAGMQAMSHQLQADVKSYYPKLNGFGQYQFNDNRMFGYGAGSYLVGLQFQWDLFAGNQRKIQYATHRNERDQLSSKLKQQQDQAQQEIRQVVRQAHMLSQKYEQQQLAKAQAEEALRILQNRYQQGLVNTTDVLLAQTQLAQQELALQQIETQQQLARAQYQYLHQ